MEYFGRIEGSLLIEKHDGELSMEHLAGLMKASRDVCSSLLVMKTLGSIKAKEREEIFLNLQFQCRTEWSNKRRRSASEHTGIYCSLVTTGSGMPTF